MQIHKWKTILCTSWHKQTTNILRSNTWGHISLETWEAPFVHLYNPRNSDILIPFHWCLSSYPLWKCVVIKYSEIPSLKADIVSWWPTGIYSGFASTSWKKNSQQQFFVNAYTLSGFMSRIFLLLFVSVNWIPHIMLNSFYQCGLIMWLQSVNELLRNGKRPSLTSKTDFLLHMEKSHWCLNNLCLKFSDLCRMLK